MSFLLKDKKQKSYMLIFNQVEFHLFSLSIYKVRRRADRHSNKFTMG